MSALGGADSGRHAPQDLALDPDRELQQTDVELDGPRCDGRPPEVLQDAVPARLAHLRCPRRIAQQFLHPRGQHRRERSRVVCLVIDQVTRLALDGDGLGRRETITVDDGSGPQTANLTTDFSQGAWVHIPINVVAGRTVTVTVTRTAGLNAVLSGVFLG